MTQIHERFYEASLAGQKVTIFATFHPAAVLRGGRCEQEITADFARLKGEIEKRGLS